MKSAIVIMNLENKILEILAEIYLDDFGEIRYKEDGKLWCEGGIEDCLNDIKKQILLKLKTNGNNKSRT